MEAWKWQDYHLHLDRNTAPLLLPHFPHHDSVFYVTTPTTSPHFTAGDQKEQGGTVKCDSKELMPSPGAPDEFDGDYSEVLPVDLSPAGKFGSLVEQ